jgi:amino acid transporter
MAFALQRNFGFVTIFGFALIIMSTWETILSTVAFGLGNGGPGGLLWTFLAAWFGFLLVGISMAEMASMAPTSGTTTTLTPEATHKSEGHH